MVQIVRGFVSQAATDQGRDALNGIAQTLEEYMGSRGSLDQRFSTYPRQIIGYLNYQPPPGQYEPSLTLVIGENEQTIAGFARDLIQQTFADRRHRSLLHPMISFIFDEADIFVGQRANDPGSVVEGATLLARRGRKFGLGLGIATQRIRYLDTSIMAQPHTYFISKLPRKTDREAIADAFAISEESLEQSFSFTPGQWLVASHDATGLKGTPFPVQLRNANDAVREWLNAFNASHGR